MAKIILANEGSTPATPASGSVVLYTVGGVMHLLDSSGTPHPVDSSGITAGPTGSGATYTGATALADAIAAATAVAPATVGVLPGQYTEDLTLPAGVSLVATFGTVQLNGSITLTGLTSFQTVSGFLCQNIYLTAGAPSSATVILNHCQIEGDDTDPAVVVSDAGWNVLFASCGVDGVTRRAVMSAAADIQGTSTSFKSTGAIAIESTGSLDLQQCSLDGGMTLSSTAQADLLDTTVHFDSGTAPYAFFLDGTSQLRLKGGFSISGIDSTAGTLWKGTGTFQTNAGTFLGAYNSGFLPTVDMGSEGALAFAVDMGALALVASGAWAPVGGGGGGVLTSGTWAARPKGPSTGQQYLVADEGGFAHGDLYTAAQPNRWDLTSYRRIYYPHSPTWWWQMEYTIAGPAFTNSGWLGGQDLAITGGFITGLPGGFNSIASRRTSFTGNAHANGGTAPKSTANVSLAIWYKPTAATGAVVPLLACVDSDTAPTAGVGIWQNTTIGSVIAKVNGFSSTFAVPSELINQDNLLILVYNQANAGAELTLYANGLGIGSIDTTAAAINWFGCTWMIGNSGTALPVSGELCQAAAWDGTTLSSLEVQQIFERGVGTYTGS